MITDKVLSTDQIKSLVLQYVEKNPGCTPIKIVESGISGDNFSLDLPVLLDKLVKNGELIEVECIPMNAHVQGTSLFYPKSTKLEIGTQGTSIAVTGSFKGMSYCKVLLAGTKLNVIKQ